ncbi:MAG: Smr/MutS family protein [Syntrophobacteraceae bacterium]
MSSVPHDDDLKQSDSEIDPEEIMTIPVEDFLDLHTFQPKEVKNLLYDYIEAACGKGFREVRIIHGKGTGTLREKVHSILKKHPQVSSFYEAEPSRGGWGATVVNLHCTGSS